ncbi:MAG TPA: universal stress protein, partial [Gaiellales bacterium]|nr:universal stress protein [Gaiellales bacterium]
VALDGSAGSTRALEAAAVMAREYDLPTLHALAVAEPGPRFAATVGEVDEVKREKDSFFAGVAQHAREQAEASGVELEVDVRAGHAAELITRYARGRDADLVVVGPVMIVK